VLEDPATGKVEAEISKALGVATNNVAEYTALLLALEEALRLGVKRVEIFADSQLLVRQLAGQYKVKHPNLLGLWQEARRLLARFEAWQARHIPRAENARADRLANEALDALKGK
jgi:probable phosphoglycerate mutase